MLYPIISFDAVSAANTPNLLPPGTLAVIPLAMTTTRMTQITVIQVSQTEDFALRGWVSLFPAGISLIAASPDFFAISRMTPRPLVLYIPGQVPPASMILAPVSAGQYHLNILNLTNSPTLFAFQKTDLA